LITSNEDRQTYYDKFRNRIMFPIRDARGKMTGFGARTLDTDGIPKYLNSPQTELFNKGHLLYGLDVARKAIHETDQVVIVEGYMDVIIPHQAGFTNTVSPMGTALSVQQLRQLKKLTQHIILALDPDAAGEKATLRGLEIARQTMDREEEIVFDARGLLHQEARLQADIRVCQLPDGLDPDEIILRRPEEWANLLKQAKPIVIHVMDTLVKNQNIEDSKVKGQIAEQVLPLIEDVPNPVEREDYRQRLARLLKVDERSLMHTTAPAAQKTTQPSRRTNQQQQPVNPKLAEKKPKNITHEIEIHILQLMMKAPEMIHQLDRWLQSFQLERVQPSDFHDVNHQMIASVILAALTQDQLDPEDYIQQELDEQQQNTLKANLENTIPLSNYNDRKIKENLIHDFIRLRKFYIEKHLEQLNFLLQDLSSTEDQRQLGQIIIQETVHRNKLDKALHKPLLFS